MPASRWHQDAEVAELIRHMDEPERYERWDRLTASEIATVLKELDRCRKDFVYAARNYFWITNKKLGDQLFSLWPSQELILQKILEMRAKGIPQKIIIIKARQLGCSTLIEALICWRTVFFSGVNALVVSKDINHAAYALWPIMQFIYDRLPWWLQPMCSTRKAEEGMTFDNPKYEERRKNPGLNSRIYVKGATSAGVGQGIRLSAVHVSEFADFDDHIAKEIIDEDMVNALVEDRNTFAILESTAKGANRYAHKLWKRCIELEKDAEWFPLFLPWFFEGSRVRTIVGEFRPDREDTRMRERVHAEWVRCDNPPCMQYHVRFVRGEDRDGTHCNTCQTGVVRAYTLADDQLAWIQHRRQNAKRDDDSRKKLLQEMASTAEESFQLTGYQVFGPKEQEFAQASIRPPIAFGDFDSAGKLHGCNARAAKIMGTTGFHFPCFQSDCPLDHTYDDSPLMIWEFPEPTAQYSIGADVAEGLGGKNDFSVGACIRYSPMGGVQDAMAAVWRSNTIDPIEFAGKLFHLGQWYNSAQLAVECNKYDVCIGTLRFSLNYPNTYRWKHLDSVNINSNKLGWWTDCKSRPRMYQTFRIWLKQEMFLMRSRNCYDEMLNFVKDEADDSFAAADKDEHDDEIIATMIALYTAHEGSFSEHLGMAVPREQITLENARYRLTCLNCHHVWPENRVDDTGGHAPAPYLDPHKTVVQAGGSRCPVCNSRTVQIDRNGNALETAIPDDAELLYKEATLWTPETEFENAVLPYELL